MRRVAVAAGSVAVWLVVWLVVWLAPAGVHAHAGAVLPGEVWRAWTFEPFVTLGIIAALLLYARGLQRIWRRAGPGRGVRHWEAWCFAAGMLLLVMAMVSPLDALGGTLFAAHMTQHVLLISAAAPLLVLGAPLTAMTWALPLPGRRAIGRIVNAGPGRGTLRWLALPAVAWLLHAIAIWVWHVPALYSATVGSDLVHTAQHASFLGTAVLFWWALRDRATHGLGVLYLFTTAVHSSLLGALLAFSPQAWYAPYEATAPLWGLTALEDQQIGGFIMWVPAGLVYFVAALALLASWLRMSGRRVERAQGGAHPLRTPLGAPRASQAASRTSPAARTAGGTAAVLLAVLLSGCGRGAQEHRGEIPGGDPRRGQVALQVYGCGACHEIRGVRGADGRVGPSLSKLGGRVYIAGYLPNEPASLMRWIMSPTALRDPTAMPDLGVTEQDARDIVAYLYSLRE